MNGKKKKTPSKEKQERTEATDSLVRTYIKKRQLHHFSSFDRAFEAAKLGASEKAIDDLVKACIKGGELNNAFEAAKLGASERTKDLLVKAFIIRGLADWAQQAANLREKRKDLTTDEIDILVRILSRKRRFNVAFEASKLGASEKAIDYLVKAWINRVSESCYKYFGEFDPVLKAAKLGVSQKVIDDFLEVIIKKDVKQWGHNDKALQVAKLGASQKAIDDLIRALQGWKGWGVPVLEAAKLGASPEVLKELQKDFVQNGLVDYARKVVKLRGGEDLSVEEIKELKEAVV